MGRENGVCGKGRLKGCWKLVPRRLGGYGSEDWEEEGRCSCQRLLLQENKIREHQWTGQGRLGGEYVVIPKPNIVRGRNGGRGTESRHTPSSPVFYEAAWRKSSPGTGQCHHCSLPPTLGALKSVLPESLGR